MRRCDFASAIKVKTPSAALKSGMVVVVFFPLACEWDCGQSPESVESEDRIGMADVETRTFDQCSAEQCQMFLS